MSDDEHQWVKQPFTSLVERRTCFCGAILYFPTNMSTAAVEQARQQNEKHGKEGYHDRSKRAPSDLKTPKEEKNMPEEEKTESITTPFDAPKYIPPIPPRPDTAGKSLREKLRASHDYYEANKAAILHELDTLGEKAMLKHWGITQGSWGTKNLSGIRNRWRPEKYGVYISGSMRRKMARIPAPIIQIKKGKKTKNSKPTPSAPTSEPEKGNFSKPESTGVNKSNQPHILKFPDFNEKWPNEICIAWMKCYVELYNIDHRLHPNITNLQVSVPIPIVNKNEGSRRGNWFFKLFGTLRSRKDAAIFR